MFSAWDSVWLTKNKTTYIRLPIFNFAEYVIKKAEEIQFIIISSYRKDNFT